MDDMIEISELKFDDEPIFGSGIELLMNDKVIKEKSFSDIKYDDLTQLEKELNDYTSETKEKEKEKEEEKKESVRFQDDYNVKDKTWDGFTKLNQIPLTTNQETLSKEDTICEKIKILKKLETLEKKGIELSKKYTMDSPLNEMLGEYESIKDEKSKQSSIKFQGDMLKMFIQGIERLNGMFDFFGINLIIFRL